MELSKKVGYIKGLMAGLKIDESTAEGQVLAAMSDLLEEMAEEVEINAEIIDNITAYIDEIEDQCDCLDDIYAEECDCDPFECDDEECECDCCAEETAECEFDGETADEEVPDNSGFAVEEEVQPVIESVPEPEAAPVPEQPAFSENVQNNSFGSMPAAPQPEPLQYECCCPICGRTFGISQSALDRGSANCPGCGELLEFE